MHQNWGKLLFMHWTIDAKTLGPLIPAQLSIDTFDGKAWIAVVPFTMWGIRASFLPPVPGTSAFHELNVRTYVHRNGVPGVWFFSLDAANSLAVWGARTFYHLPYFNAQMSLQLTGETISYSSKRTDQRGAPAEFQTSWNIGEPLAQSQPDSLAFFLTERYCLYSFHRDRLFRSRIFHQPWPLCRATLVSEPPALAGGSSLSEPLALAGGYRSTMIESLGIEQPEGGPILHYAESIAVDIWPLKRT
ncbi:MAG TPA: DUF2071 domain-containing protein [Pyrinomonadaceae bacterium]|nr:DUF2071 domain-containing protein [Pyrinomonadaceae bacterium]